MARKLTVFVFLFLLLVTSFTPRFSFAEADDLETIKILTDKILYFSKEAIVISGEVTNKKMPIIAIRIFDPDYKILGAYSIEIDDNNHFTKTIIVDTPFYEKSGLYTISAEYGKLESETFFEIKNEPSEITNITSNTDGFSTILPQITSFETDKNRYDDKDAIMIRGRLSAISEPQVTITIFDPYKTPVGIYLANVNPDLTFSVTFVAKYNVNFKVDGAYTITAQYGRPETKQSLEIEFSEKTNQNTSTTIESNAVEHTDQTSSDFLFSESELQQLATWYYLEGSDDQLALFFRDLLKNDVINPNVSSRISTNILDHWIHDTKMQLGTMVDKLFKENISEKEFIVYAENSLSDHINTTPRQESAINNISDTTSTKSIEKSEIGKSPKFIDKHRENEIIDDTSLQTDNETIYYYSSVNCKKNEYEDVIAYYNNPGPGLARLCKNDEAILNYDQTLESDPKNIHALNNKGSALSDLGRYQEAIVYYDKVLEIDSQYAAALNNKEKATSFLITYSPQEMEPKTILISEVPSSDVENEFIEKTDKPNDIVAQFANVFSSIGASLMSLFGG